MVKINKDNLKSVLSKILASTNKINLLEQISDLEDEFSVFSNSKKEKENIKKFRKEFKEITDSRAY